VEVVPPVRGSDAGGGGGSDAGTGVVAPRADAKRACAPPAAELGAATGRGDDTLVAFTSSDEAYRAASDLSGLITGLLSLKLAGGSGGAARTASRDSSGAGGATSAPPPPPVASPVCGPPHPPLSPIVVPRAIEAAAVGSALGLASLATAEAWTLPPPPAPLPPPAQSSPPPASASAVAAPAATPKYALAAGAEAARAGLEDELAALAAASAPAAVPDDERGRLLLELLTTHPSPDRAAAVDAAIRSGAGAGPTGLLAKAYNIELRHKDMAVLAPRAWLKDEVINLYLQVLLHARKAACEAAGGGGGGGSGGGGGGSGGPGPLHIWNTFFWTSLTGDARDGTGAVTERGYNYKGVARWSIRAEVDVFAQRAVLVPINHGNSHWAAVFIWPQIRRLAYVDSIAPGPEDATLTRIERWLADEHADKKGAPLPAGWQRTQVAHVPQQDNGCDCGVFMCAAITAAAHGLHNHMATQPRHIVAIRRSIGAVVLDVAFPPVGAATPTLPLDADVLGA